MAQTGKLPREGVLREEAGRADREGFIAPSIGVLAHALYFATAPSVTEKAKLVLDGGRLRVPGAVVVWNETIGRRKGSKAVPKSWWAGTGSLTVAFAFPARTDLSRKKRLSKIAAAVVRVIDSFRPEGKVVFRPPNDLLLGDKKMGAIFAETYRGADLTTVRLNCDTDFSAAPEALASNACRLIDFIDVRQLPLKQAGTLPNTFLLRLMTELPKEFGAGE